MLKNVLSSKKRLISFIVCVLLSITVFAWGAVLLSSNKTQGVKATTAQTAEFKVLSGAAIRYNEETPGIRFSASVNKAQFEEWASLINQDGKTSETIGFRMQIRVSNYKEQDGELVNKDELENPETGAGPGKAFYLLDTTYDMRDITKWDFDRNGDFIFSSAVYLDKNWKDGTPRTQKQLHELYSEATFEVVSLYAQVFDPTIEAPTTKEEKDNRWTTPLTLADNTADTARTIRSVALALYAKGSSADEAKNVTIQKSYLEDFLGFNTYVYDTQSAFFYDLSANTLTLPIEDPAVALEAGSFKAYLGAKDITANVTVAENVFTVSGLTGLTAGDKLNIVIDAGASAYSYSNVTVATKIITTAEEFKSIFTQPELITGGEATYAFNEAYKITESVTAKDGTVYTQDFYSTSAEFFRGYYVLGADIDLNAVQFAHTKRVYESDSFIKSANGLFGFGGTFDGNGHTITNFTTDQTLMGVSNSGLFGALAFGATIKNVAITKVISRSNVYQSANELGWVGGEAHRNANVVAGLTGSSKALTEDTTNFVMAKFGTTDNVIIEDLYVALDRTKYAEGKGDPFYSYDGSKIESHYKWGTTKRTNNTAGGTLYVLGGVGIIGNPDEATTTMRNVVFDMPNLGNAPFTSYAGMGFYNYNGYVHQHANVLENCYLISEPSDLSASKGKIAAVQTNGRFYYNDGTEIVKLPNYVSATKFTFVLGATDGMGLPFLYEDMIVGVEGKSIVNQTLLAANDYDAIMGEYNGNAETYTRKEVYQGLNGDTGLWEYKIADGDTVVGNSYIWRANGVTRYDNLTDLLEDGNLANLNPQNWDFTGESAVWKTNYGEGLQVEFLVDGVPVQILTKGDVATVKATLNGTDVSAEVVLSVDNENALAISGNTITCSAGTAKLKVSYTYGDKEFVKHIGIDVEQAFADEIYVSADESLVRGSNKDYSTLYAMADNKKDYTATTLQEIYALVTGNSSAVMSEVLLMDGQDYVAQTLTTDDAGAQALSLEDNNTITQKGFIILGNSGPVKVPNVKVVTAVVADEYGFNYIPLTEETRSGYYVLANDFECWTGVGSSYYADTIGVNKLNIQAHATDATKQIAYSFGARVIPSLSADVGFNGTFDGLGHTVNNMEVAGYGLLGNYGAYDTLKATVKNVKFTNFRNRGIRATAFDGTTYTLHDFIGSGGIETILCNLGYVGSSTYYKDTTKAGTIRFENIILEMATSGFSDRSRYNWYLKYSKTPGANINETGNGRVGFIRFNGSSGSNASYIDIRLARTAIYNCVFKYETRWNSARGCSNDTSMVFYSFGTTNDDMGGAYGNNYPNAYIGFLNPLYNQNVVIISQSLRGANQSADDLGKVVSPYSVNTADAGNYANYGLATNDYEKLGLTGQTSKDWYMGYDNETDYNYIYTQVEADVGVKQSINGKTKVKLCNIANYYRYDTYEAMFNAGKTVGDAITITADGANFN